MSNFQELVKNLYTSKNRELTEEKLQYIEKNYKNKEQDFVKNFYATIGEELTEDKFNYINDKYLKKNESTNSQSSGGSSVSQKSNQPAPQANTSQNKTVAPQSSVRPADTQKGGTSPLVEGMKQFSQEATPIQQSFEAQPITEIQKDVNAKYNTPERVYENDQKSVKQKDDEIRLQKQKMDNLQHQGAYMSDAGGLRFQKDKTTSKQWVADNQILTNLENERKRLATQANKANASLKPELDKTVRDVTSKDIDKLITTGSSSIGDVKVPNQKAIIDLADKISKEKGLGENSYYSRLLQNAIGGEVSFQIKKPEIEAEFEKQFKQEKGQTYTEFTKSKEKESLGLAKSFAELEATKKETSKQIQQTLKAEYEPEFTMVSDSYKQQLQDIELAIKSDAEIEQAVGLKSQELQTKYQSLVNNGSISVEEATKQLNGELTKYSQNVTNEKYPNVFESAYQNYLDSFNGLNQKLNARYTREFAEVQSKIVERQKAIKSENEALFKKDPKLEEEINAIYNKAYGKVLKDDDKKMLSAEQGWGSFGALKNSFMSALGSSLKGTAIYFNSRGLEKIGASMKSENLFIPEKMESFSDLLDLSKMMKNTGSLGGSMLPTMIPAIGVTLASGGLGAPSAISMLLGGGISWMGETATMVGNIENETFAKTGSVADANKAGREMFKGQIDNMYLYTLDMLPFTGVLDDAFRGVRKSIATPVKILSAGTTEVVTETAQEFRQGSQEEAISKYMDVDRANEFMTKENLKSTFLTVSPTFFLGMAGQAKSSFNDYLTKRDVNKDIASLKAKTLLNQEMGTVATNQYLFDMVANQGADFAMVAMEAMYTQGVLNKEQFNQSLKAIQQSTKNLAEAKDLGLSGGQAKVYSTIMDEIDSVNDELRLADTQFKVNILEDRKKILEREISDFANTKKTDRVIVQLADESQFINTAEDVVEMMKNPEFAMSVRDGDISINISDNTKSIEIQDALLANLPTVSNEEVANKVREKTPLNIQESIIYERNKSEIDTYNKNIESETKNQSPADTQQEAQTEVEVKEEEVTTETETTPTEQEVVTEEVEQTDTEETAVSEEDRIIEEKSNETGVVNRAYSNAVLQQLGMVGKTDTSHRLEISPDKFKKFNFYKENEQKIKELLQYWKIDNINKLDEVIISPTFHEGIAGVQINVIHKGRNIGLSNFDIKTNSSIQELGIKVEQAEKEFWDAVKQSEKVKNKEEVEQTDTEEKIVSEESEISEEEYNDFIDKGNVTKERLTSIAEKAKNKEELSPREQEIFTDKTSEINNIIKKEAKQTTDVSKVELPNYGKTVDTKIGKVDLVIEPNPESDNKNSIKVSAYNSDGETLGFSSAVIDAENKTLTVKVSQIKDKYQRNGIYSKIIDEYENIAKEKGLKFEREVEGETKASKDFWNNREKNANNPQQPTISKEQQPIVDSNSEVDALKDVDSTAKEGFTEGKDLNKMFADLKSKYGDKKGSALYEVANRLVNPNKNTIVEIRANGVVVKEGDKYILKPFGNTDANSKKWTLYKGLDVTDQFQKSVEQQPIVDSNSEVDALKDVESTDKALEGVDTFHLVENEGEWKATTKTYRGREIGNWAISNLDKKQQKEYLKIRDEADTYGTKEQAEENLKKLKDFEQKNKEAFERAKQEIDALKEAEERKAEERKKQQKIFDQTEQELNKLSDKEFDKLVELIDEKRRQTLEQRFGDRVEKRTLFITPISESYHKAKADGSNPELVKAVEELLTPSTNEKANDKKPDTERAKEEPKVSPADTKVEPTKEEVEKEDRRIKNNRLFDLVRQHDRLPLSSKGSEKKGRPLMKQILDLVKELGYSVEKGTDTQRKNGTLNIHNDKGKPIAKQRGKTDNIEVSAEETEHAKQEVKNNGWLFEWGGDMFDMRLDLGGVITWSEIRKGYADIKAGKDSVPARRLIKAINEQKEKGGYDMVMGSGSMTVSGFVSQKELQEANFEANKEAITQEVLEKEAKEFDEYIESLSEKERRELLDNIKEFDYHETEKNNEGATSESTDREESKTDDADKEKTKVFRGTGKNVKQGENDAVLWVAEDRKVAENYSEGGDIEEIEVVIPSNPFEMPLNVIYVRGVDVANRLRAIRDKQFKDKKITRERALEILEAISDFEKKAGNELELYSTKTNKKESVAAFVTALKELGFDGLVQKESYNSESPFTNTITGNETNTYGIFKEQQTPNQAEPKVSPADNKIKQPKSEGELAEVIAEVFGLKDKKGKPNKQAKSSAKLIAKSINGLIKAGVFKSEKEFWDAFPTMTTDKPEGISQDQMDKAKGYISIARNAIHAFIGSDVSTPLHEVSHWWLANIDASAKNGNIKAKRIIEALDRFAKSPQGKAYWDNEYGGKFNPNNEVFRQELFARGFENYLRDGKAPDNTLKSLFEDVSNWFKEIYQSLTDLGIEINGEMSNVYSYIMTGDDVHINTKPTETEAELKDIIDNIASEYDYLDKLPELFQEKREAESDKIKSDAISDGTFMKAPNGEKSNLNEKQWVQVRTKAFKDWFGDWQNDPKNASKVVDDNGEPLVVYHGTSIKFNEFRKGKELILDSAIGSHFAKDKQMAENIVKRDFGRGEVREVFLNIRNSHNFLQIDENNGEYDGDIIRDYVFKQVFNTNNELFERFKKEAKGTEDSDNIDSALEYYDYFDSFQNTEFRTLLKDVGDFYNSMPKNVDGIIYKNTDLNEVKDTKDATSYIAFNPNQIKSATDNSGDFSKSDDSILFQEIETKKNQALRAIANYATKALDKNPDMSYKEFESRLVSHPITEQLVKDLTPKAVKAIFRDKKGNTDADERGVNPKNTRKNSYTDRAVDQASANISAEMNELKRTRDVTNLSAQKEVADKIFDSMLNSPNPTATFEGFNKLIGITTSSNPNDIAIDSMIMQKIRHYYADTLQDGKMAALWTERIQNVGGGGGVFNAALANDGSPESLANAVREGFKKEQDEALAKKQPNGKTGQEIIDDVKDAIKTTPEEAKSVSQKGVKTKGAKDKAKNKQTTQRRNNVVVVGEKSTANQKKAKQDFKAKAKEYINSLKDKGLLQNAKVDGYKGILSEIIDDIIAMGAKSKEQALNTFINEMEKGGMSESDAITAFNEVWSADNDTEMQDVVAQDLANSIVAKTKSETTVGKKETDPIKILARALLAQVADVIPKETRKGIRDKKPLVKAYEKLAEVISNKGIANDAWVKALESIKETVNANSDLSGAEKAEIIANVEDLVSNFLNQPLPKTVLRQAVKDGIKDLGIEIDKVIENGLTDEIGTGKSLAERIVEQTGLDAESAQEIERAVVEDWNKKLGAKKETLVAIQLAKAEKSVDDNATKEADKQQRALDKFQKLKDKEARKEQIGKLSATDKQKLYLSETEDAKSESETKVEELSNEIKSLEKEMKEAISSKDKESINDLTDELNKKRRDLSNEKNKLKTLNEKQQDIIDKIQETIDDLYKKIEDKNEKSVERNNIKEAEKQQRALDKFQKLRESQANAKDKAEKAEKRKAELENLPIIERKKVYLRENEKNISDTETEVSKKENEITDLESETSSLEREIPSLENDMREAISTGNKQEEQRLATELTNKRREVNKNKAKLDLLRNGLDKLNEKLDNLNEKQDEILEGIQQSIRDLVIPREKKPTKKKHLLDKIMEAMNQGVLNDDVLTKAFADKFGFGYLTNGQIQRLKELKEEMTNVAGIERKNKAKRNLVNYLATLDRNTSRKVFSFLGDTNISQMLSGIRTWTMNIPIGSLVTGVYSNFGKIASNIGKYKEYRKLYKELGLDKTGAFLDILKNGYNQLDEVDDIYGKMNEKGSIAQYIKDNGAGGIELDRFVKNKAAQKIIKGYLNLQSKFQIFGYFANAFDAIMSYNVGEYDMFLDAWERNGLNIDGSIRTEAEILQAVKEEMGYDGDVKEEVEAELEETRLKWDAEGFDYKQEDLNRERRWLMMQKREIIPVKEALQKTKSGFLMGTPTGAAGFIYEQLNRVDYVDKESKPLEYILNTLVFTYKMTLMPFLRIATKITNIAFNSTPILGSVSTMFFEFKPVSTRDDKTGKITEAWGFVPKTAKERRNAIAYQTAITGTVLGMLSQMFKYDDDDDEDKLVLDPNRLFDFTLKGGGELNSDTPSISIGVNKGNGEFMYFPIDYIIPLIIPTSILGFYKERSYYRDFKGQTEDVFRGSSIPAKIGYASRDYIEATTSGLSEVSFMRNLRIIKQMSQGDWDGLVRSISSPFKMALPAINSNLGRDVGNIAYDIADIPQADLTPYQQLLGGITFTDPLYDSKRLTQFGKEKERKTILKDIISQFGGEKESETALTLIKTHPNAYVQKSITYTASSKLGKKLEDRGYFVTTNAKIKQKLEAIAAEEWGKILDEKFKEDYDSSTKDMSIQDVEKLFEESRTEARERVESTSSTIDMKTGESLDIEMFLYKRDRELFYELFPKYKGRTFETN